MPKFISVNNLADILGTSIATAQKWGESGVYPYHTDDEMLTDFSTLLNRLSGMADEMSSYFRRIKEERGNK